MYPPRKGMSCELRLANNSLERTQPGRGFMFGVELLRRSARGR